MQKQGITWEGEQAAAKNPLLKKEIANQLAKLAAEAKVCLG